MCAYVCSHSQAVATVGVCVCVLHEYVTIQAQGRNKEINDKAAALKPKFDCQATFRASHHRQSPSRLPRRLQ